MFYVVFAALGGFLVVVLWAGWLFVYGDDLVFRLDCDTVVSACGLCDFGWFWLLVACWLVILTFRVWFVALVNCTYSCFGAWLYLVCYLRVGWFT